MSYLKRTLYAAALILTNLSPSYTAKADRPLLRPIERTLDSKIEECGVYYHHAITPQSSPIEPSEAKLRAQICMEEYEDALRRLIKLEELQEYIKYEIKYGENIVHTLCKAPPKQMSVDRSVTYRRESCIAMTNLTFDAARTARKRIQAYLDLESTVETDGIPYEVYTEIKEQYTIIIDIIEQHMKRLSKERFKELLTQEEKMANLEKDIIYVLESFDE